MLSVSEIPRHTKTWVYFQNNLALEQLVSSNLIGQIAPSFRESQHFVFLRARILLEINLDAPQRKTTFYLIESYHSET